MSRSTVEKEPDFRASTLLVACGLMLSLATWGMWAMVYLGKIGDEAEAPLILLTFLSPLPAIAGVIFTISGVDLQASRPWRVQLATSIVSAILAILALIMLYEV